MADSLEKNNGFDRDSGEVPVDFQVEIHEAQQNGNEMHNDININVEGSVGRDTTGHSSTNVEKPVETLEPVTSQLVKAGRGKQNHNRALGLLAAKLFDEKVPLRKKLKLFNRLATVQDDGTVQFEVPGDIKPDKLDFGTGVVYNGATGEAATDVADIPELPPLQIVMLIVGTRGDVQPFVAIGKKFQENGHRVRLATHANFREFVLGAGLEFYPLGGDPKVLAACE